MSRRPSGRKPGPGARGGVSYDIKVWTIRVLDGARGRTYRARWVVAGAGHSQTFKTRALADSFRAELVSATRRGDAFDVKSGLPTSMRTGAESERSWFDHACRYVDMKWPTAAGNSRRSIADTLATVTPALLDTETTVPERKLLRRVLYGWAFNAPRRKQGPPPDDLATIASWVSQHTLPLADMDDPAVLRGALDALASKQDGSPAAANTLMRKRALFYNVLEYAVELGDLPTNPLVRIKWTAPKVAEAVDPRVLVDRRHAEALLTAVAKQSEMGPRLVAFFGCMYYAGMRPAEVADLRKLDLRLPSLRWDEDDRRWVEPGTWGEFHLSHSSPALSGAWNDSGQRRESRQLKHRAREEVRPVPCHPRLVELLRRHLDDFGTAPDGRLFRSHYYNRPLSESTYAQIWRKARATALTEPEAASPLAARPYDLRHACVTTWLNAGVDPAQVAEWAGHSVAVLLRVYVRCIVGRSEIAKQRIERALDDDSRI